MDVDLEVEELVELMLVLVDIELEVLLVDVETEVDELVLEVEVVVAPA